MALGLASLGDEGHGGLGEEQDRDPNVVEDRFRVDRRKLEQMLQAGEDGTGKSGEQFFQEIMEQTATHITWPSKLKIGAKSKKDPHIKIEGLPENVRNARDRVMAVLDTKSNRVTLKMDVSHTDHSHIIGKGGGSIRKVMSETGCHIHFPDSNRGSSAVEKSNQVSIAGQPLGVECARVQIRELLPLVLTFDLPHAGHYPTDPTSPPIQFIAQAYNVSISFKLKPRMGGQLAIVRGSQQHVDAIQKAVVKLVEHFTGNITSSVMVNVQIDVAQQHHLFIIGKNGSNIKQINQSTGASITFPDPNSTQRKGAVYISGSIQAVIHARAKLMNCLPLVLMFDLREEDCGADQDKLNALMETYDVFVSIKPKPKQATKSVIIKSSEKNADNMYAVRRELLGLDGNDNHAASAIFSTALAPDSSPQANSLRAYYGIAPAPSSYLAGPGDERTNPALFWGKSPAPSAITATQMPNYSPCPPPPGLGPPNAHNLSALHRAQASDGHSAGRPRSPTADSVLLRSPSPPSNMPLSTGRTCSPIGQRAASPLGAVGQRAASPAGQRPSSCEFRASRSRGSSGSSSPRSPTPGPFSLEENDGGMRPRSVSLLDSFINPTGDGTFDSQSQSESGQRSRRQSFEILSKSFRSSNGSLSPVDPTDSDPLSASYAALQLLKYGSDSPHLPGADYGQMQSMASKAMGKKIENPEVRTPTNTWSGLGFSKSMPESAIKEMLNFKAQNKGGMLPYNGSVDGTFEESSSFFTSPMDPKNNSTIYESPRETDSPPNCAGGPVPAAATGTIGRRKNSVSFAPSVCEDLEQHFERVGLADKYLDIFRDQEVDLPTFLLLSDDDLKEIGVKTVGARKKMLKLIADLTSKPRAPEARTPSPPSANSSHFSEHSFNTPLHRRFPRLGVPSQSGKW